MPTSKEYTLLGNIAAYLDITTGIRAHRSAEATNSRGSNQQYVGHHSSACKQLTKIGNIQSLTSRNAVAKYNVRKRGAIFSDCFNLSDCGLLTAACKVEDIVGDVQCFA